MKVQNAHVHEPPVLRGTVTGNAASGVKLYLPSCAPDVLFRVECGVGAERDARGTEVGTLLRRSVSEVVVAAASHRA